MKHGATGGWVLSSRVRMRPAALCCTSYPLSPLSCLSPAVLSNKGKKAKKLSAKQNTTQNSMLLFAQRTVYSQQFLLVAVDYILTAQTIFQVLCSPLMWFWTCDEFWEFPFYSLTFKLLSNVEIQSFWKPTSAVWVPISPLQYHSKTHSFS